MASNHLEDLVAEWYLFNGFFVRRNVLVGKRPRGGYECELDVVAFHPKHRLLVHVEPSLDGDSWADREARYLKKFEAGRKHIPDLFIGMEPLPEIEHIALFVSGSRKTRREIAGGRVLLINDFLAEIMRALQKTSFLYSSVPEHLPNLRTLQLVSSYWKDVQVAMTTTPDIGSSGAV